MNSCKRMRRMKCLFGAWAGGELADTTVDLSVVLHWLMTRGDDYLERMGRDFAAEVQRKRVRFGLQTR